MVDLHSSIGTTFPVVFKERMMNVCWAKKEVYFSKKRLFINLKHSKDILDKSERERKIMINRNEIKRMESTNDAH